MTKMSKKYLTTIKLYNLYRNETTFVQIYVIIINLIFIGGLLHFLLVFYHRVIQNISERFLCIMKDFLLI